MEKKIRIIRSEPELIIFFPMAIVILLLLILINFFIRIRIGFIRSERIGHFVANTELYLCEKYVQKNNSVDIFYFTRNPCNEQISIMWKRCLIILPRVLIRPVDLIIRSFPSLAYLHALEARGGARDIDNYLDDMECHLKFSDDEEIFGKNQLQKMGIEKNAKFVCLNVRDNAYLKKINKNVNVDYHNYRNSSIDNYNLACEYLVAMGYYVIRMGVVVEAPMCVNNPKIIDYAVRGLRSDFMDVFLGANCEFAITTGSGWDAIPEMMRRPLAYVNFAPTAEIHTFSRKFLYLIKIHQSIKTGVKLSLSEIFNNNVGYSLTSEEFQLNDIALVENSPEEIRDAAMDMVNYISAGFQLNNNEMQKLFFSKFPIKGRSKGGVQLHGEIRGVFSNSFLLKNKEWFLA